MQEILRDVVGLALATGALSLILKQVLTHAIQHVFEMQRLKIETEFKRMLETQHSQLELWGRHQDELFKNLLASKGALLSDLAKRASLLRCAILGIGVARDADTTRNLYERYCDLYYANPIVPDRIGDAAHAFRQSTELAMGALAVLKSGERLHPDIVHELDKLYGLLVSEIRQVLLPRDEERLELPPVRGAAVGLPQ